MYFKKISDLFETEGFPPSENPLFALRQIEKQAAALINKEISCDFYMICFKKLKSGEIWYGKTKYDHDKGFTFFMKPRQRISTRF